MAENNIMELDLLDAELEAELAAAELQQDPELNDPIKEEIKLEPDTTSGLVADEPYDRFEALPRPSAIFLHGVDDLSTAQITSYVNSPLLTKVEWINDSACNLAFKSEEDAQQVIATLTKDPSQRLSHRKLVPAKPFTTEDNNTVDLFIRVSTDEDIKERGARAKSRYYQVHGIEGQELSEERKESRRQHIDRMKKNGGDGRDVFSRLGQRRRSISPSRSGTRELPDRLRNRLGNKVKDEVKPETII